MHSVGMGVRREGQVVANSPPPPLDFIKILTFCITMLLFGGWESKPYRLIERASIQGSFAFSTLFSHRVKFKN